MRGETPTGDKSEGNDGFKRSTRGRRQGFVPPATPRTVQTMDLAFAPSILVVVVGYFLLTRLGGSRSTSPQASAAVRASVPVSATEVKRGDLNRYLTAIGTVTAFNTVTLKTRVDGQIVKVAFKEGQTVHKGDLLLEIDPRPYQAALAQAEGQLAKDQATLLNAKITLERDRSLYQQGVIAAQDFDNQQSLVGQSAGAVESDQANIAAAKVQVAYTPDHRPNHGTHRTAPGGPGQHRPCGRYHGPGRDYSVTADCGGFQHSRGQSAAGKQGHAQWAGVAGGRVRPGTQDATRYRHAGNFR